MSTPTPPAELPESVEWRYNPWVDAGGPAWRRPWVALLLELGLAALAGYSLTAPNWWPEALPWALMSLAILLAATASLYLPVRYRLGPEGVTVWFLGVPSTRTWDHYRNYYVHDTGVHLTTMPQPSALDPFRGHMLLFAGNRESVVPYIKARIRRPGPDRTAAPEGTS
jgi:hypothetical protein